MKKADVDRLPKDRPFWVTEAANILYPNGASTDSNGRYFNRCAAVTARILRQDNHFIEVEPKRFQYSMF